MMQTVSTAVLDLSNLAISHRRFVKEGILNKHALQGYLLYAGQHPDGGLRDKPPKYDTRQYF